MPILLPGRVDNFPAIESGFWASRAPDRARVPGAARNSVCRPGRPGSNFQSDEALEGWGPEVWVGSVLLALWPCFAWHRLHVTWGKALPPESSAPRAKLLTLQSLPPEPQHTSLHSHPGSLFVVCQDVQEVSLEPQIYFSDRCISLARVNWRPQAAGDCNWKRRTRIADPRVFFPRNSGISSFARAARPTFAARAVRPAALRVPFGSRFASTSGVGDGKIYQVSGGCRWLILGIRSSVLKPLSFDLTSISSRSSVPSSMVSRTRKRLQFPC
jgi:hypothetical protein